MTQVALLQVTLCIHAFGPYMKLSEQFERLWRTVAAQNCEHQTVINKSSFLEVEGCEILPEVWCYISQKADKLSFDFMFVKEKA